VTLAQATSWPMHPVHGLADQQQHHSPPNSAHSAYEDPQDSPKLETAGHHLSHSLPSLHHTSSIRQKLSIWMIRARVRPTPSTRAFHEGLTNPTHERHCINRQIPLSQAGFRTGRINPSNSFTHPLTCHHLSSSKLERSASRAKPAASPRWGP